MEGIIYGTACDELLGAIGCCIIGCSIGNLTRADSLSPCIAVLGLCLLRGRITIFPLQIDTNIPSIDIGFIGNRFFRRDYGIDILIDSITRNELVITFRYLSCPQGLAPGRAVRFFLFICSIYQCWQTGHCIVYDIVLFIGLENFIIDPDIRGICIGFCIIESRQLP